MIVLGKYEKMLFDDIGNEYQRKNMYLKDRASLDSDLSQGIIEKNQYTEKIREMKKNHPYFVMFQEFKNKEKDFLRTLKIEKRDFISNLDKNYSNKIKKLKIQLFESEKKYDFYKKHKDLSYESQLKYKESQLVLKHLPKIIEDGEKLQTQLNDALKARNTIDKNKDKEKKEEIKQFKNNLKLQLKKDKLKLREKRKAKTISEKALKNGYIE